MWAKVDGAEVVAYPYGPSELRRDNPNVSLPDRPLLAALSWWGIVPVVPKNPPEHDYITQDCTRVNPTKVGDDWVETWVVSAASPAAVAERTAEKAVQVRSERDRLLAQSDWTQLPDAPVDKDAWGAYRTELRNIPQQAGFPAAVVWPTMPE